MFTVSVFVAALLFSQVQSTPFVAQQQHNCQCGPNCQCNMQNNCGCLVPMQSRVCSPNGCETITTYSYRNTIPNSVQNNYSGCANGSCSTCGPDGCNSAAVNSRFYYYPQYRTRRFRLFRRW